MRVSERGNKKLRNYLSFFNILIHAGDEIIDMKLFLCGKLCCIW